MVLHDVKLLFYLKLFLLSTISLGFLLFLIRYIIIKVAAAAKKELCFKSIAILADG
jgi:uncharacterized membrane protein YGL010W